MLLECQTLRVALCVCVGRHTEADKHIFTIVKGGMCPTVLDGVIFIYLHVAQSSLEAEHARHHCL